MLRGNAPFVLLEDARPGGAPARLFAGMQGAVVAHTLADVEPALEQLRAALRQGRHVAGWMSYEAGVAFEPRLMQRAQWPGTAETPLLWFGLFDAPARIPARDVAGLLPSGEAAWLSPPGPRVTRAQYDEAFTRAHDYLIAGDMYQVNLSYRADVALHGHPLAAYARLRAAGQGGWSGVVHDGAAWLLSTSPELFFRLLDGVIETRPMKGTAKRCADPEQDRAAALALKSDPKEIAENVMIVDLLRNDLSRVAKRGSVHVPELFAVETYPTLHTLTSTVRAELRDEYDAVDVLRTLFPCGSITGAPKIRAMEIIRELETDARGPYSGAIGWMSPDGEAEFNVAIRTLVVREGRAEVGLGSAVVLDSTADAEWAECQTKGAFVTANAPAFHLIETMRCEPGVGVELIEFHIARLRRSADAFGFRFDEREIGERIAHAVAGVSSAQALRLTLEGSGKVAIAVKDAPVYPHTGPVVALAPLPVARDDFRLRHKTSLRGFYDDARVEAGADEVIFVDPDGFITEGSISNVFVERGGVLLTPPTSRGLLPGVLRASLVASGSAREADLRVADLETGFFLGNAVRGLVAARLQVTSRVAG